MKETVSNNLDITKEAQVENGENFFLEQKRAGLFYIRTFKNEF